MAHGVLRCVGSPTELKERYGEGTVVDAKAHAGRGDELAAALAARLPGCAPRSSHRKKKNLKIFSFFHTFSHMPFSPRAECAERHGVKLRFVVPRASGLPLSKVFARIEEVQHLTEDWSVGASSLDAVFVNVAAAAG